MLLNKRCLQKLEFSTTDLEKALAKIKELEEKIKGTDDTI